MIASEPRDHRNRVVSVIWFIKLRHYDFLLNDDDLGTGRQFTRWEVECERSRQERAETNALLTSKRR
jgi:hypothetical protein